MVGVIRQQGIARWIGKCNAIHAISAALFRVEMKRSESVYFYRFW